MQSINKTPTGARYSNVPDGEHCVRSSKRTLRSYKRRQLLVG